MDNLTRRDFVHAGLVGMGSTIAYSNSWASVASNKVFNNNDSDIDVIIELTANKSDFNVVDGKTTTFWSYSGKLLKGAKDSLITLPDSYLGPVINVNSGDRVRIVFKNSLDEASIVHWHGLDVSHENDGHPEFAVQPGGSYQYDFEVENRAGMYWYHPHPHGRTGFQVYHGLAGLFIVRDKEEKDIQLPSGEQEMQFVLQDRVFDEKGKLDYRPNMMGVFGDHLLVNGVEMKSPIRVGRGKYRVRLLNGCNARVFDLSFDSSEKFTQIGSDGGLLESPQKLQRFFFAPAERVDLVVDFSKYSVGDRVKIENLPLGGGQNDKTTVLEFEVTEDLTKDFNIPSKLSVYEVIEPKEAVNYDSPKLFQLYPKSGVGWTINGYAYEHDSYYDQELINFGDTEIWEFHNPTGMAHPMHIHGTQFQVIERISGSFTGCLDSGWKDTVLLMAGDRVKVIKRFNTFKGKFIYHCHNLEHEDMSMMRNFKIT